MAVDQVHQGLLFPWEGRWGVGTEGLEPSLLALMYKGSSDSGRSQGGMGCWVGTSVSGPDPAASQGGDRALL